MATTDQWDPRQYQRFQAQRRQPFDDLLHLLQPTPRGRVVDLGCGSGELTALLHEHLRAERTVGIDTSPAMLAEARSGGWRGVTFEQGDIEHFDGRGFDAVVANASLQWVPDHHALLPRLRDMLAPGGQLAFQVPANADHPSHVVAAEVGDEAPFAAELGGERPGDRLRSVLPPERYAEGLDRLGAIGQHVRLQIYGHHLDRIDDVVEWVRGTLLTSYRARLSPETYVQFLERYRQRLRERLEPHRQGDRPYFYAYRRLLVWARFG